MQKKLTTLLYILAIVRLVLPFFLQSSYYQPHRDEFLYLAEGRHLAWGYMEVPPLLSVFAAVTHLMGEGAFWIKCWPALFGSLTFLVVGRIVLSLGGKAFALVLSWLPFVLDVYMRLFFLFQPNFLEVFFWTAMGYCVIRWIQAGRVGWLYGLGVSIGLGMMSKYSVAFYTVCVLAGLAISRHRSVYRNKHFYFSLLLAGLIFLPNALGAYPVLFAFGGFYLEQLTAGAMAGSGEQRSVVGSIRRLSEAGKWVRGLMLTYSLALGIWVLPLVMPMARPETLAHYYHVAKLDGGKGFKWEDLKYHPLPQDYGDMIGWKEMALKAGKVYNSLPRSIRDSTLIFTPDYCTAGALNYYRKEAGLPEVYSTNASFLFWMPDSFPYRHCLRVDRDMPEPGEAVFRQFGKMTLEDSLVVPYFRESGMKYFLFENGNDSLRPMVERIVAKEKKVFMR